MGIDKFHEIRLFVDGHDLIDMLKQYEKPFAERERCPDLAGRYIGLSVEYTPKEHFLGVKQSPLPDDDGRIELLKCTCGVEECWPFESKIIVTKNTVRWQDFLQPQQI